MIIISFHYSLLVSHIGRFDSNSGHCGFESFSKLSQVELNSSGPPCSKEKSKIIKLVGGCRKCIPRRRRTYLYLLHSRVRVHTKVYMAHVYLKLWWHLCKTARWHLLLSSDKPHLSSHAKTLPGDLLHSSESTLCRIFKCRSCLTGKFKVA